MLQLNVVFIGVVKLVCTISELLTAEDVHIVICNMIPAYGTQGCVPSDSSHSSYTQPSVKRWPGTCLYPLWCPPCVLHVLLYDEERQIFHPFGTLHDILGDDRGNVSYVGRGVDSVIIFISFYLKFGRFSFDCFIIPRGLHASCFIKTPT
jgi:hypothetical protein